MFRNYRVFVAGFIEFLSDEISISSSNFDIKYHRNKFTIFLWNYEVKKAKKKYASDDDDSSRSRSSYVPLSDDSIIIVIE